MNKERIEELKVMLGCLGFDWSPNIHEDQRAKIDALKQDMTEHPVAHLLASPADINLLADLTWKMVSDTVEMMITKSHEVSHMTERPDAALLMMWFFCDGMRHICDGWDDPLAETIATASTMAMAAGARGEDGELDLEKMDAAMKMVATKARSAKNGQD